MDFFVDPYRFVFRARDTVHFPLGRAANIMRGALGRELRRLMCPPECPGAAVCEAADSCAYARIFEPRLQDGPSGFADQARPFVLRCEGLDGKTVRRGEMFSIGVNGFDPHFSPAPAMAAAFTALAESGLGTGRGAVEFVTAKRPEGMAGPMYLSLADNEQSVSRVRVSFVSPTSLKSGGQVVAHPDFHILASRVRDRVSNLRRFYQNGALEIDFAAFGRLAREVRMVSHSLRRQSVDARSGHSGHVYPLGGFLGHAEYEGPLDSFLPLLRVAYWTGVGQQTVWGHGAITVNVLT